MRLIGPWHICPAAHAWGLLSALLAGHAAIHFWILGTSIRIPRNTVRTNQVGS